LGGHAACMGVRRGAHSALVAKPDWKGPLGRPTCEWKVNIGMDFLEVGWEARTGLMWFRVGKGGGHL